MARAPDIVEATHAFHREPAQVLASLLGLVADTPHVFELSEATEQSGLGTRVPRTQPGYAPPDYSARVSSKVRVTATYFPRADFLRLEGHFADLSTALPARSGPRIAIISPSFIQPPPGWDALFRRLSATRVPLDATFARISLLHAEGKSLVEVAFDPPR